MQYNKGSLQRGELDFIDIVVIAILKNDTSKKHYLLDDNRILRYESLEIDQPRYDVEFKYEDGTPVKIVCVFDKDLIEDFNAKAGNDDLSKYWTRRAVNKVIQHGKKVA